MMARSGAGRRSFRTAGRCSIRLRPSGSTRPASFSSNADLQQIRHAPRHRDDAAGECARLPNSRMRFGGGTKKRELALRLVAVGQVRRYQRTRGCESRSQQRDARVFRELIGSRCPARRLEQLGDGSLVHGGVLPQVEAGEMKAEAVGRAAQRAQAAARDDARTGWRSASDAGCRGPLRARPRRIGGAPARSAFGARRPRASARSRRSARRSGSPPTDRARPARCGEESGELSASARSSAETSTRLAASDSSAPSSCSSSR